MQTDAFVKSVSYIWARHVDNVPLVPHKKKTHTHTKKKNMSYGMSTGILPFSAILGKQSTISHISFLTEPGTRLLKSPTLQPDADVIYAHTHIYIFHLALHTRYAYFPVYFNYWTCLWRNTTQCQGKQWKV